MIHDKLLDWIREKDIGMCQVCGEQIRPQEEGPGGTMTHSLSPYPASVTIKPIADGSQVFQHGRYRGYVEKRNNWGVEWVARPEEGECRVFKEKVKAVRYLLTILN